RVAGAKLRRLRLPRDRRSRPRLRALVSRHPCALPDERDVPGAAEPRRRDRARLDRARPAPHAAPGARRADHPLLVYARPAAAERGHRTHLTGPPTGAARTHKPGGHHMGTTTAALNTLSGTYEADPVHSSFGFSVRYQGVSIFRGSLTEVEAGLRHGRLEGTAKVDSISIRTPEQFRAHVLSSEFFDAANHPEVKFVSTTLAIDGTGAASVTGDLTIKGITSPI